jgi:hypothetical protein
MEYEIELYPEECCEECNEIVHVHFSCPVCKDEYAGTSYDWYDGEKIFECEECDTKFKILKGNAPYLQVEILNDILGD